MIYFTYKGYEIFGILNKLKRRWVRLKAVLVQQHLLNTMVRHLEEANSSAYMKRDPEVKVILVGAVNLILRGFVMKIKNGFLTFKIAFILIKGEAWRKLG